MPELQSSFLVSEKRIATCLMLTLKEIAAQMDCHERTAKRWWKKLGVPPDVIGHGAHKWKERTAARLLKLYADFYKSRGTTPQITRAKYMGDLYDARQLTLFVSNPSKK